MGLKTSGAGYFQIPTQPAAGTSVTSGSANAYSASYVQMIASTSAALFIVGVYAELSSTSKPTYGNIRIATGAGGAENVVAAKTDQLTFTSIGEVDANIHSVNDTAVTGTGAEGDTWGPA